MLQIEVEINKNLAGELATRIMALWPEKEVKIESEVVSFSLAVDENLDQNLRLFENTLQKMEKARALDPLTVKTRNAAGPDAAPRTIRQGRFLICQPGIEVPSAPEQIVLTLAPSQAFGSGAHPSTALALAALAEFFTAVPGRPSPREAQVLDAGTGSGILALAAASLGAGPILAVDPSAEAIEAARVNAELNGLAPRLELRQAPVREVSGQFDLILANLVYAVLLKAARHLVSLLAPGGTLIVAGFSDAQAPRVVKLFSKTKALVRKSYSRALWSALALTKES